MHHIQFVTDVIHIRSHCQNGGFEHEAGVVVIHSWILTWKVRLYFIANDWESCNHSMPRGMFVRAKLPHGIFVRTTLPHGIPVQPAHCPAAWRDRSLIRRRARSRSVTAHPRFLFLPAWHSAPGRNNYRYVRHLGHLVPDGDLTDTRSKWKTKSVYSGSNCWAVYNNGICHCGTVSGLQGLFLYLIIYSIMTVNVFSFLSALQKSANYL